MLPHNVALVTLIKVVTDAINFGLHPVFTLGVHGWKESTLAPSGELLWLWSVWWHHLRRPNSVPLHNTGERRQLCKGLACGEVAS